MAGLPLSISFYLSCPLFSRAYLFYQYLLACRSCLFLLTCSPLPIFLACSLLPILSCLFFLTCLSYLSVSYSLLLVLSHLSYLSPYLSSDSSSLHFSTLFQLILPTFLHARFPHYISVHPTPTHAHSACRSREWLVRPRSGLTNHSRVLGERGLPQNKGTSCGETVAGRGRRWCDPR